MDKGNPRRRQAMSSQNQQKMIEDPRIKVIDKNEIDVFKCDECGGQF